MNLDSKGMAGAAFLVFLMLAIGLLIASVTVMDTSVMRVSRYGSATLDDHTVSYSIQTASPGDVVVLHYDHFVDHPIARYDFLVTEHEDAHRLERGEPARPGHIYYEERGITKDDCCHRPQFQITRPEAPSGEPSNEIALVWIYWHAEDVPPPANETARQDLRQEVLGARFGTDTAETIPESAVRANRILFSLSIVTGGGALLTGGLWVRRGVASVVPPDAGQETEALVTLITAGRNHLRLLRAILAFAFVLLLLAGFGLLAGFFSYLANWIPAPTENWFTMMQITSIVIWLMLPAACLIALVQVHRTLKTWEQHMQRDPFAP